MEILRRTPWSRIREQNSVYKEFLEIVGNGKPTGSVLKETLVVSATISISVDKFHHQIRLRILSCSRVSENHRGPEVPGVKARVVECRDGLAHRTGTVRMHYPHCSELLRAVVRISEHQCTLVRVTHELLVIQSMCT